MPDSKDTTSKTCHVCGSTFLKSSRMSQKSWDARKSCSRKCKYRAVQDGALVERLTPRDPERVRTKDTKRINAVRQSRIDAGMCRDCGGCRALPGRVICKECSDKRANGAANRNLRKRSAGLCQVCGVLLRDRNGMATCANCTGKVTKYARLRRKLYKQEVVEYLGGRCTACGEIDIRCLTVHHINGDGSDDRRSDNKKGKIDSPTYYSRLYRQIKTALFPTFPLELLCFNCHAKKDLAPWWCDAD